MSTTLPNTFKAWVAESAGAPLVLKELELKPPTRNEVLVKVLACGICFTDIEVQLGHLGPLFPRIPGHEIIGDVVGLGEGVTGLSLGDRVGGAWHGGHDNVCRSCRSGMSQVCDNVIYNGASRDGGYAEYVLLRSEAIIRVPKDVDPAKTAPLLCAGLSVFNSIRKMHIEQGSLVAVQGVGGLGHMAIQYARKMGYKVAALSSGSSKKDFALELGAHEYIDTSATDGAKRLQELGGAALILSTAPNPTAITALTGGLQRSGKLVLAAAVGMAEFNTIHLIMGANSVHGWMTGNPLDAEDAIAFAKDFDINCMVERFPFGEAPKAIERMTSGAVRFRSVLVME